MWRNKLTRYLTMVFAGVLLAGCAVSRKPESLRSLQPPICEQNFVTVFKGIDGEVLTRQLKAAEDGGCWEAAFKGAVSVQAPLAEFDLVKGLQSFNRQANRAAFEQVAELYLTSLASGQIVYGEDQQRFLEAYSRHAIRNAHSQESQTLKLAQQVSWRLDRVLYTRLFE